MNDFRQQAISGVKWTGGSTAFGMVLQFAQMAVLARINELVSAKAHFIIATHSPILMAYPDACIYELSEAGISEVAYTDTEHYAITRSFLNNPEKMLSQLIDSRDPPGERK